MPDHSNPTHIYGGQKVKATKEKGGKWTIEHYDGRISKGIHPKRLRQLSDPSRTAEEAELVSPFSSKRSKETASPMGAPKAQFYGDVPRSPVDGSPMLKVNVGGAGGARIPVYIDQQNRICIPIRKH